jgi:hypothetical protein
MSHPRLFGTTYCIGVNLVVFIQSYYIDQVPLES